jgi:hypothetical protein
MRTIFLSIIFLFLLIGIISAQSDAESICELKENNLLKERTNHITTTANFNYIAINNIKMWAGNNGANCHDPETEGGGFLWPGGESATISAIFLDGLLLGGKISGEIRVSGNNHRFTFRAGKILNPGIPDDQSLDKYRVYKIRKDWESLPPGDERNSFQKNLVEWPVEDGAPWEDKNGNGTYDVGEAQFIGDEVLWFVCNDMDTIKTQSAFGDNPFGFEIHTLIYAYNQPGLEDVVFRKNTVINKSNNIVQDMFLGYFVDPDLGNAVDDRVGSHPILNMGYCYNADNNDEGGYGTPPPGVGHMILQGPVVPSTNSDSAYYKNKWHNGYKNLPLTSFMFYNCGGSIYSCPSYGETAAFYNGLQGKLKNGDPVIDPVTGLTTTLVLNGDPSTKTGWYEGEGWPGGPKPGDRYYIMGSGPFNFAPGDTQEIVIATAIAQGTDNINSVTVLKNIKISVQQFFNNVVTDVPKDYKSPDEFKLSQNYPNPFNPSTTISYHLPAGRQGYQCNVTLKLFDVLGKEVAILVNEQQNPGIHHYTLSIINYKLSSGVYFYQLTAGNFVSTKKLILIK